MKYPNLGLRIENKSDSKTFILDVVHYSTNGEPFEVTIDNGTNRVERLSFKFTDSNEKIQNFYTETIAIPTQRNKTILKVEKDNPAIYTIYGKKIDVDDHILLELKRISYLFKKSEKYFLHIDTGNIISNKIELVFK